MVSMRGVVVVRREVNKLTFFYWGQDRIAMRSASATLSQRLLGAVHAGLARRRGDIRLRAA